MRFFITGILNQRSVHLYGASGLYMFLRSLSAGMLAGMMFFPIPLFPDNTKDRIGPFLDEMTRNHLSIKSMEAKSRSSGHAAKNASRKYPDPEISISRITSDREETGFYPSPTYQSGKMKAFEYRVLQPLPFPGKLTTEASVKKSDAALSQLELEIEKNRIAAGILTRLDEINQIQLKIVLTQDFYRKMNLLTKIISSRYGTGSGNLAGITNAKRKTGEYNDRLILLKGEYESARISLEYYLSGKNENFSNGELQKYFSILRKRIPSEDELEGRSLDIAVQKELQKRSQREKNRSRLSFAPDMGIFAGYKKEEMEKGAMSYGYRNQKTYTVGITLKIPLWSSFASVSNYKEKKETLKSSDLALEDIKRRIKYEYRSSDQMLQVHEKRLKLLDSQLIPQANLSLKSSKLSWETKKTDFNALLDAYDSLYRENILRIETESEKNKKIIDLSYLQNSFL